MHIKLALPEAVWLSIFFMAKSALLQLHEGPELRTHYRKDRAEIKAHHLAGFKPTTSRVLLQRRVAYRCATTAALI